MTPNPKTERMSGHVAQILYKDIKRLAHLSHDDNARD